MTGTPTPLASHENLLGKVAVEAELPEILPPKVAPTELGGRKGPEPTRFGDWERNGRCIDF